MMISSPENDGVIARLNLTWDHTAPPQWALEPPEPPDGKRELAPYFEFLAQFKPSLAELRDVQIFDKPFFLPDLP